MSGIAAAVALGGGDLPERADLLNAIRPRGRDGASVWGDQRCLLAHTHSAASGPAGHNLDTARAELRIVGDVRLDNCDELAAALGIHRAADLSDTDIVLAAYRAWGPLCCTRLAGDFAFAIWHEAARTLFCARDQFGVRPMFYSGANARVIVSSELDAVVPAGAPISESRIAGYLLGLADDPEATAYTGASRLPPGHWLRVTGDALTIQRYWSLEPEDIGRADRAAEFRERFESAVEIRLRGAAPVGAMLSGGLDSSAIVSSAASRYHRDHKSLLPVYSFDYPGTPRLSERPFVDAVLARHALDPVFIGLDDLRPADGLDAMIGKRNDLFFAPGIPKVGRVYREAHRRGTRVILEGHGGDEVVSHGFGRIRELAQGGHWVRLYHELDGVAHAFGESPTALLAKLFASVGPGRHVVRVLRRLGGGSPPVERSGGTILNPEFARSTGAEDRRRAWLSQYRDASRTEDTLHRWTLTSPAIGEGFEVLDRAATQEGVELRYPFFDQRLVRYAISLPASEKLRDGWSRSILRRAMDGILPREVQWRRDKIDFTSEIATGLARHHRDLIDDAAQDGAGIGRYLDLGNLRRLVGELKERPAAMTGPDLFTVWRSLFLMLWLRNEGAR